MKRSLTDEEIGKLLDQEDQCGICDCLQQIFCIEPQTPREYKNGVDFYIIGDFNEQGQLGDYEVRDIKKELYG